MNGTSMATPHAAGVAFINHLFGPLMGENYAPIRTHRAELPPGPAVEIIIAIYRSAQTGKPVKLPLTSTPNFLTAGKAARKVRREMR